MKGKTIKVKFLGVLISVLTIHISLLPCFALTEEEIRRIQASLIDRPVGEKIALWAEKFVGTPYDMDPLGEYVTKKTIVADERMDCMYLTFRAVELALTRTPDAAVPIALEKRFHSQGILRDGRVMNYDDRFEYGEDMIESRKWGREVTSEVGMTVRIKGARGKDFVDFLAPQEITKGMKHLKSGDILFFIKRPEERERGEIVGHIGIIKVEPNLKDPESKTIYLIHASGTKKRGGMVKKVLLKEYLSTMGFLGGKITRFD